jgi:hypothetical protein
MQYRPFAIDPYQLGNLSVSSYLDTLRQKSRKDINCKKVAEALSTQLKRMPMHSKRATVKAGARLKGTPSRAPKKSAAAPALECDDNSDLDCSSPEDSN